MSPMETADSVDLAWCRSQANARPAEPICGDAPVRHHHHLEASFVNSLPVPESTPRRA